MEYRSTLPARMGTSRRLWSRHQRGPARSDQAQPGCLNPPDPAFRPIPDGIHPETKTTAPVDTGAVAKRVMITSKIEWRCDLDDYVSRMQ